MRDPTEDERIRNPGGSRGFRTGLERYPHALSSVDFPARGVNFPAWGKAGKAKRA